ncbi:hypothetical protein M9H77_36432 [Catharanthus roseus]|uniref:Uncharacterized protein n=1 Tax=Catharanthus roseus TaxID=4058 RepID=A0ACB9ZTZ7_CATRO|nr:hypothetical protein M9H77_36432 [Catharanthus roseus]
MEIQEKHKEVQQEVEIDAVEESEGVNFPINETNSFLVDDSLCIQALRMPLKENDEEHRHLMNCAPKKNEVSCTRQISFSKTNRPSSRSMVPKSQASTYKSWQKKEDTPKVAFKDHSKHKVEEKGRLIPNLTGCFTYNGLGHIAINCPTKRTLVFSEDLEE